MVTSRAQGIGSASGPFPFFLSGNQSQRGETRGQGPDGSDSRPRSAISTRRGSPEGLGTRFLPAVVDPDGLGVKEDPCVSMEGSGEELASCLWAPRSHAD